MNSKSWSFLFLFFMIWSWYTVCRKFSQVFRIIIASSHLACIYNLLLVFFFWDDNLPILDWILISKKKKCANEIKHWGQRFWKNVELFGSFSHLATKIMQVRVQPLLHVLIYQRTMFIIGWLCYLYIFFIF